VAGLGTERVRDLREVLMTLSEDQLKGLEAITSNLYHAYWSLHNLQHQKAERLFFK
jgi:hypothetical protein